MITFIVLFLSIFVPGIAYLKWSRRETIEKGIATLNQKHGENLAAKAEPYLCQTCQKVNFDLFFTNNDLSIPCQMTWVVRLKSYDSCTFCTFLREIVAMHDLGPRIHFVKIEFVRAAGKPFPFIHIETPWDPEERFWLHPGSFGAKHIESPWTIRSVGSDVHQQARKHFVPWKKAAHFLDIGLAKNWVAECIHDHRESCSPVQELIHDMESSSLGGGGREQKRLFQFFRRKIDIPPKVVARTAYPPDTLRLIDVKSWCLHSEAYSIGRNQVPQRYVALSYVWGENESKKLLKANLTQWSDDGGLPRDLPRTILHAIELTLAMGEQYLWTDRLCIVQDDPKEMGNTMQHMHSVYMNAVFTIVAASGTHSDAGLKGFAPSQPWSSPTCSLNGRDLALSCVDPLYELYSSKWITRGWTFQEIVCSRRSLLLMGSSVAFFCGKSIMHQDRWGVCDIPHSNWTRSLIPVTAHNVDPSTDDRPKALDENSSTRQLEDLLRGYLTRDLTKQSDRLNAFAGILSHMESELGKHHFGLPVNIFGNAIAWSAQSIVSRGGLWQPSWSWVGWEFSKQEPSLEFPQGEAILCIYRGDDLNNPLSVPITAKISRFSQSKADRPVMEKALARIQPSRRKTPYFVPHRLAQLQKEHVEASLYSLLANHLLVFFTSCLPLNSDKLDLKEGRPHDGIGTMRRWDVCDHLTGVKWTSMLLPADTRPGAWRSDFLIVIQKDVIAAGDSKQPGDRLGYRLMLIRTEDGISHRLGVTEGCVGVQQWQTFQPIPTRELIVLG